MRGKMKREKKKKSTEVKLEIREDSVSFLSSSYKEHIDPRIYIKMYAYIYTNVWDSEKRGCPLQVHLSTFLRPWQSERTMYIHTYIYKYMLIYIYTDMYMDIYMRI